MAVDIISESWAQVSYITMNNCWKQLWPECIKSHVDEGNALELSKTETLNLFQQVGFENINQQDIEELLTSHQQELENEELLQIQHFPVIYDSDEEILEHDIVELNSNSSNELQNDKLAELHVTAEKLKTLIFEIETDSKRNDAFKLNIDAVMSYYEQ